MKILFISGWYPYPPDNGSKIRIYNLIKHLSSRHEIDLVSFASEPIDAEPWAAIRRYCQRVDVARRRSFQPGRLKALLGFLSPRPRSIVDTYSVEMQRLVEQAGRARSFDVVIASEMDMAPYALAVLGVPRVLEDVELTTLYEQYVKQHHPLKKLRSGLTWWKLSRYTFSLLRAFEGCTVVSEQERTRVLQILPGYRPIGIVPNGVDTTYYATNLGRPEADTLVYSGALTYSANFDAVNFFLRKVFPLIQAKRPNVKLRITGKVDGVPIDRLPVNDGVVFTGYLDDIRPTVARSWASIVPLRIGGGTRLKILEALALGTPVISTSKGVEGLALRPEESVLIGDTPVQFADQVLRLLGDDALRSRLSINGRRQVEQLYDWHAIGMQLDALLTEVIGKFHASRQMGSVSHLGQLPEMKP